jgi:hypothetical protein
MPENESIHDRITQLVNKFGEGKNTVFASIIGSSEANVRGYRASVMPKYDFLEKIARNFDIDLNWLLTGRGSMLRSDGATDTHNIPITDTSSDSNMHSDTVTLRLMDKLDEKDNIIKEKEAKIEQLQTELREKSEELAALKAFHQHIHIRGYHDQPDIEGTRKGLGQ